MWRHDHDPTIAFLKIDGVRTVVDGLSRCQWLLVSRWKQNSTDNHEASLEATASQETAGASSFSRHGISNPKISASTTSRARPLRSQISTS
jgi:hypothetical protein